MLHVEAWANIHWATAALVMAFAYCGLQSFPDAMTEAGFEQAVAVCCRLLLMGSVALAAYAATIFALVGLCLRSAQDSGRGDSQADASFSAQIAGERRGASHAFVGCIATFGLALLSDGVCRMRGSPVLQGAVCAASLPMMLYTALRVRHVMTLFPASGDSVPGLIGWRQR